MAKQFVEPLIAENAKLKEIIKAQQHIIDAKMAELESKRQPFIYSEDGVKVRWNAEDEGWEDVCGDCNKPWCDGGEYDKDNQWFCEDCYVVEDEENEDEEFTCITCDGSFDLDEVVCIEFVNKKPITWKCCECIAKEEQKL